MKKLSKGLLALVLAMAMMLSVMPMSLAAEEETATEHNVTITYDIQSACMPDGKGATTTTETGKNPDSYCTWEETNEFFDYVNDSISLADSSDVKILNEYGLLNVKYNDWLILQLNVPVAGEYEIYVNNNATEKGLVGNFYISDTLPETNAHIFTTDNFVGELQTNTNVSGVKSGIGGSWAMTFDVANAVQKDGKNATYTFTTAGKYYMAIKAYTNSSLATDVTQDRFQFGNIYLVSGDGSENALVGNMTLSSDSVKAGETATATATAYKSDDGSATTVTYASSDTDVATVDPATGVITTKKQVQQQSPQRQPAPSEASAANSRFALQMHRILQ